MQSAHRVLRAAEAEALRREVDRLRREVRMARFLATYCGLCNSFHEGLICRRDETAEPGNAKRKL